MTPSVLITGAPSTGAAGDRRPNRLEINDLIRDETQFSLYIQALRASPLSSRLLLTHS